MSRSRRIKDPAVPLGHVGCGRSGVGGEGRQFILQSDRTKFTFCEDRADIQMGNGLEETWKQSEVSL